MILIWFVFIIGILILDGIAYCYAKFPESMRWYYLLPFGGFICLIRFGKNALHSKGVGK